MRFSPGIYEHAAALIGRSPWEVSRDSALLSHAHQAAWNRYHHPLVVAGIDVYNPEAEACGAVVPEPTGNNIPAIASHPCSEASELLDLKPLDPPSHPRLAGILQAGRDLRAGCPGARVMIPVCGPFALAMGLLGMDELLVSVVEDPELLARGMRHLLEGQRRYLSCIHDHGLEPLIFESGTTPPLLPVRAFEDVEAPLLTELIGFGHAISGRPPGCIIGGDAAPVAGLLLAAGPGFVIAPSETDQAAFLEAARNFPDTHVRVNMSAAVLLDADFDNVRREADRCLALARQRGNTSVGCGVVPYEADPEIVCRLAAHVENGAANRTLLTP